MRTTRVQKNSYHLTYLDRLAIWQQPAAIINQSTIAATLIALSMESLHCNVITSSVPWNNHTLHILLFKKNNQSRASVMTMRNSVQMKNLVHVSVWSKLLLRQVKCHRKPRSPTESQRSLPLYNDNQKKFRGMGLQYGELSWFPT
jgi:hypothetical protein